MIVELLHYLFLPHARLARRVGALRGLIALDARARRCRHAWAPHQAASKAAIVAALDHVPGRDLAVVCGSGLLQDVPLEALAERFARVVLVDLCHLPAARAAARRFATVSLLEHDLSGVLEALAARPATLPEPAASIPDADRADLVVSANCLSQIPLGALGLAKADDDALAAWAPRLVAAHLDALRACAGTVVLVSDVEQHRLKAADGMVEDTTDLLFGVPEPALLDRREWWWDLAPAPEALRASHLRHRVVAGRLV